MKILVIGAGGETGQQIVGQALEQGHTVTALVHTTKEYDAPSAVQVIEGDVLDATLVERSVSGQDAVVDALGGHTPWKTINLETNAARNVIRAMQTHGVRRLVVISAIGVGGTEDLVPIWYEKLIMPTLLRGAMHDKETMEPEVEHSGLEWTLVRPGHLVGGERTSEVRTFQPGSGEKAHKITRADVAAFILEAILHRRYIGEAVNIASD